MRPWLLLTGLFAILPSTAQVPGGDAVLQAWVREQARALQAIDGIEVEASSDRVIEGPEGARRIALDTRLAGAPGDLRWESEIMGGTVNGRRATGKQLRLLERQHGRFLEGTDAHVDKVLLPLPLLAQADVERAEPVRIDGVPHLRLDLVPPGRRRGAGFGPPPPRRRGTGADGPPRYRPNAPQPKPLRQASLWFDRERGTLTRSRLWVDLPRGGDLTVTTEYERIGGLDLPVRRRVEGTFPMQRRLRSFTVGIDAETVYGGYRFTYR